MAEPQWRYQPCWPALAAWLAAAMVLVVDVTETGESNGNRI